MIYYIVLIQLKAYVYIVLIDIRCSVDIINMNIDMTTCSYGYYVRLYRYSRYGMIVSRET